MDDTLDDCAPISDSQLEILVSYMEKYPNLATGKNDTLGNEKRTLLWFNLSVQLNAVAGGARKTSQQWKRIWKNQKMKSRMKATNLISTEGNSDYLTPLEERIVKILCMNNDFKSPQPSSDVFLIPETGIVFSLPIVAQDEIQSKLTSSTPSTSQSILDPSLISQKIPDSVLSELNDTSVTKNFAGKPDPPSGVPVISSSSTDIPLIEETQGERKFIENTTRLMPEHHVKIEKDEMTSFAEYLKTINNPCVNSTKVVISGSAQSGNDFPSSTTASNTSKKVPTRGRKRLRRNNLRDRLTADKAAETFGYISKNNCAVLECIASAMEAQASRAARQTQLMQEIVEIAKQK